MSSRRITPNPRDFTIYSCSISALLRTACRRFFHFALCFVQFVACVFAIAMRTFKVHSSTKQHKSYKQQTVQQTKQPNHTTLKEMIMKTNTTLQVVAMAFAVVVTAVSFAGIGLYADSNAASVTQQSAAAPHVETIVVTASRLV
jgi:hypothetical protein